MRRGGPNLTEIVGGGLVTVGVGSGAQSRLASLTWSEDSSLEPAVENFGTFYPEALSVRFRGAVVRDNPSPVVTLHYWKKGSTAISTVNLATQSGFFPKRIGNFQDGKKDPIRRSFVMEMIMSSDDTTEHYDRETLRKMTGAFFTLHWRPLGRQEPSLLSASAALFFNLEMAVSSCPSL